MSKKVHVSTLPSPEASNEPSSLAKHKEIKKRLLAGEELAPTAEDMGYQTSEEIEKAAEAFNDWEGAIEPKAPVPTRNPLELLGDAIKYLDSDELVEIRGPFGKIAFRAMHVSSNDYGIAFIVNKDHMTYEPNINTNLVIRHGGISTDVVYAGGYFTFRQMPFTFLSFIKITTKEDE